MGQIFYLKNKHAAFSELEILESPLAWQSHFGNSSARIPWEGTL